MVRCCETCRHLATHAGCGHAHMGTSDYCLWQGEPSKPGEPYAYRNWEAGNPWTDLLRMEREGSRNIVLGGQGEAEVNANDTPEETSRNLHHVAEECGYLCETLGHKNGLDVLTVHVEAGTFTITWKDRKLGTIYREYAGGTERPWWPASRILNGAEV